MSFEFIDYLISMEAKFFKVFFIIMLVSWWSTILEKGGTAKELINDSRLPFITSVYFVWIYPILEKIYSKNILIPILRKILSNTWNKLFSYHNALEMFCMFCMFDIVLFNIVLYCTIYCFWNHLWVKSPLNFSIFL